MVYRKKAVAAIPNNGTEVEVVAAPLEPESQAETAPPPSPEPVKTDAERIAELEMDNAALRARLSSGSGPRIEQLGVQTSNRNQCHICKGEGCRFCGGRGYNVSR